MKRVPSVPRFEWWNKVSATGLTYYAPDGVLYWDESVCYEFSPHEIDVLKNAARELQSLCEQAAQTIVDRSLWSQLGVDEPLGAAIARSWRRRDQALLGRFDLAWDGTGPPKLLEYNADTPMALIEASQTQLQWQRETTPAAGQWNGLHETLVAAWREVPQSRIHFTGFLQAPEDAATLRYLAQTAMAAAKETVLLPIDRLGWHRRLNCFVDAERKPVERVFKLYPWDWLWQEGFTRHPDWPCELFIEPLWKLLWNSKSILVILWSMFPDHPNLLPCYDESAALHGNYVRKPRLGREGCNIEYFRDGQRVARTEGPYRKSGFVYQALAPAQPFAAHHPTLGVWMISGQPHGLGIREDSRIIIEDNSRFVPHRVVEI